MFSLQDVSVEELVSVYRKQIELVAGGRIWDLSSPASLPLAHVRADFTTCLLNLRLVIEWSRVRTSQDKWWTLPPNICAKMEHTIRTKPASPVMNVANETAGLACTSGRLTDLNAWIEEAVQSPAASACWKIVGAPSHLSAEPETANRKNRVARYSASMASQKST